MTPPKCRNCGASEWRHVCSGTVSSPSRPRVTRGVDHALDSAKVVRRNAPRANGAGVANEVANSTERSRKWREANRARYTAEQRERQRLWRAARREKQAAQ